MLGFGTLGRFLIGAVAGCALTVIAGLLAWGNALPDDSGALMPLGLAAFGATAASTLVFASVTAVGIRRGLAFAAIVALFLVSGGVLATAHERALERSCFLGTGPQPVYCSADGPPPPTREIPHLLAGLFLGVACASLGWVYGRENVPTDMARANQKGS